MPLTAPATSTQLGLTRKKILVVDDSFIIRKTLMTKLKSSGYDVLEAASAERAVETLAAQSADILLIDIMLPGMSGLELCKQVRTASTVPIIMVTARADTVDVVLSIRTAVKSPPAARVHISLAIILCGFVMFFSVCRAFMKSLLWRMRSPRQRRR